MNKIFTFYFFLFFVVWINFNVSAFWSFFIIFDLLDSWLFDWWWLNRWKLVIVIFISMRSYFNCLHMLTFWRKNIIIILCSDLWILLQFESFTFDLNILFPIYIYPLWLHILSLVSIWQNLLALHFIVFVFILYMVCWVIIETFSCHISLFWLVSDGVFATKSIHSWIYNNFLGIQIYVFIWIYTFCKEFVFSKIWSKSWMILFDWFWHHIIWAQTIILSTSCLMRLWPSHNLWSLMIVLCLCSILVHAAMIYLRLISLLKLSNTIKSKRAWVNLMTLIHLLIFWHQHSLSIHHQYLLMIFHISLKLLLIRVQVI